MGNGEKILAQRNMRYDATDQIVKSDGKNALNYFVFIVSNTRGTKRNIKDNKNTISNSWFFLRLKKTWKVLPEAGLLILCQAMTGPPWLT